MKPITTKALLVKTYNLLKELAIKIAIVFSMFPIVMLSCQLHSEVKLLNGSNNNPKSSEVILIGSVLNGSIDDLNDKWTIVGYNDNTKCYKVYGDFYSFMLVSTNSIVKLI